MIVRSLIAISAGMTLVLSGGAANAAPQAMATPPSPAELRQTTTAMLQPSDVPGATSQEVGYYIPTGGQDPYPVCFTPDGKEALPDLTMTTGYFSNVGDFTEQVIVYPSAADAAVAWSRLQRRVAKACSYSGSKTSVRNGKLSSGAGIWTRQDNSGTSPSSLYSNAGLVDNAIVIVRVTNDDSSPTTTEQRSLVSGLFPTLLTRYADRASAPAVQSTQLSIAEMAMLNPADVPSGLPVRSPERGAWASFDANLPGTAPYNPCSSRTDLMPAGTGSYSVSFGDQGGPQLTGGYLWQQAYTFATAEDADAAWSTLAKRLSNCETSYGKAYSKTKPWRQGKVGTSAVTVDGTPGLHYRYVESFGDMGSDGWTTRTYQLFLKDGNVISSLTYGNSVDGIRKFYFDEAPINDLAETLIDRFANTIVTTGF